MFQFHDARAQWNTTSIQVHTAQPLCCSSSITWLVISNIIHAVSSVPPPSLGGRVVARLDDEFTSLPIESSVARACVFVERFAHHVFGRQSLRVHQK
jgi:hypothetical protein